MMNAKYALVLILLVLQQMFWGCSEPPPDPAGFARYYGDGSSLDYEVRIGERLFQQYCAVCHGKSGKGDGFNAYGLVPKPRNLSDPDFQKSLDDNRLSEIIRNGGRFRGGSNNMPAWGGVFKESDLRRIVIYIRHFANPESIQAPSSLKPDD